MRMFSHCRNNKLRTYGYSNTYDQTGSRGYTSEGCRYRKRKNKDPCIALDNFITAIDTEKENELLTEKLERILDGNVQSDFLNCYKYAMKITRQ